MRMKTIIIMKKKKKSTEESTDITENLEVSEYCAGLCRDIRKLVDSSSSS
jgi:hypothetical protein